MRPLHPACRERLTSLLKDGLQHVRVQHGNYVDGRTLNWLVQLDSVLPHDIRRDLLEVVSERPLFDFIYGELVTIIHQSFRFDGDKESALLSALDGFADLEALSSALIDNFCGLPRKYRLLAEFSLSGAPTSFERISLGRASYCTSGNALEIPRKGPEPSAFEVALSPQSFTEWSSGKCYIMEAMDGFIGDMSDSHPMEVFKSKVRAMAGLGLITRRLVRNKSWAGDWRRDHRIIVYRDYDGRLEPLHHHEFLRTESDVLSSLSIPNVDGADSRTILRLSLEWISGVVEADNGVAIAKAAEWCFMAECQEDPLLKFLFTAMSLEILLGDKTSSDVIGIQELLANRCAYLVGKNATERKEITNNVRRFYATRSAIVHRGSRRLTAAEEEDLYEMRFLLSRVIYREVAVLFGASD